MGDWCFRHIYKGGLWLGDLYVAVLNLIGPLLAQRNVFIDETGQAITILYLYY